MKTSKITRARAIQLLTSRSVEPAVFRTHPNYHVRQLAWKLSGATIPESATQRVALLKDLCPNHFKRAQDLKARNNARAQDVEAQRANAEMKNAVRMAAYDQGLVATAEGQLPPTLPDLLPMPEEFVPISLLGVGVDNALVRQLLSDAEVQASL